MCLFFLVFVLFRILWIGTAPAGSPFAPLNYGESQKRAGVKPGPGA
jgi:hypothetical protein